MNPNLSPVERAAIAAWKPQDIRLPWEWAEDNYTVPNTSPMPGPWRSSNSPWVRELMELAADKRIRFIAVKCSAQSAKTETLLALMFWTIGEDPGPEMYVMANKEDAQDFVRDRFAPSLKNCQPVNELILRETKSGFTFRTMPLYFVGAGSPGKLQGKPMKRLFLDEVRNYPPGALETVMKRVTAFGQLAQVFIISTPGDKGDAVDQAFLRGDQRTFHFPCPKCGALQQLKLENLKCEHPQTLEACKFSEVPGAKENGQWNFDVLGKVIRLQCVKCGHLMADTPTVRKTICRTGHFIRMNPNAEPCDVSFTWSALLPWWVSWRGIVKEYLLALAAARRGNVEPLRTFITETMGEAWEDQLGVIEDFEFLEARKQDYDFGEVWPEEDTRFMAADRQEAGGEHYWYVIRAFNQFGKSRLIMFGRAVSTLELENIRRAYNVPLVNSMIDSGHKASEVYKFCLSAQWKAFKGDDAEHFFFRSVKLNKTLRRIWERTFVDPYMGTAMAKKKSLPLFRFCNNPTKDLLMTYMTGLAGEWSIPKRTPREYLKQITAERREEVQDLHGRLKFVWKRKVRDNHLWDCELMIMVAAVINKRAMSQPGAIPKTPVETPAAVPQG